MDRDALLKKMLFVSESANTAITRTPSPRRSFLLFIKTSARNPLPQQWGGITAGDIFSPGHFQYNEAVIQSNYEIDRSN
jgi:hypothetical protein